MTTIEKILLARCSVRNYAWGKLGVDSAVAKFAKQGGHLVNIDLSSPYAELWMGTHNNCPSSVITKTGEQMLLADWLKNNSNQLGLTVQSRFGDKLPYLFKVLSVRTSLSIQAHPNKRHAEILHRDYPDIYKDDNHKPELAIALTEFHCLIGFRPINEIATFLKNIEEFALVIGKENVDFLFAACQSTDVSKQKEAIKLCFSALFRSDNATVRTQLNTLTQRIELLQQFGTGTGHYMGPLIQKLTAEFPGDVGIFVSFFLNYVVLQKGEAVFLGPNFPHAYLYGDCMECQACSDNVVRAGLTPKLIDRETLLSMLDYTPRQIRDIRLTPTIQQNRDLKIYRYAPPVHDFRVVKFEVRENSSTSLPPRNSVSLTMCVQGGGVLKGESSELTFTTGSVFYVAAKTSTVVQVSEATVLYCAFCP